MIEKRAKIMAVIEKYFDADLETADAAYDVLLDNECDPELSAAIVQDMYAAGNPYER